MHRFFLSAEECRGGDLQLTGHEAHHGLRVLRLRRGERVAVMDGAGQEIWCEVAGTARDHVDLKVLERRWVPPLPYQITLIQAVPKGRLLESIIQKATELGAARLIPLLSERVVIHLEGDSAAHRAERWRSVAVEAVKQCGSAWLPRIEDPVPLRQLVDRREDFDLALIGSLQPGASHPRQWFDRYRIQNQRPPRSVCVWVGPEGDFTPAEVAEITGGGALPITLGPLVLRAETAAIYCLSVVNYELSSHLPPVPMS